MPRLSTSLLLQAKTLSPFLPLLLKTCRTLPSAINELRWLKEHTQEIYPVDNASSASLQKKHLLKLCLQRSNGVPLQYLLGSQPFGDLDILCRSGVLIPRPETESYITHLAKLLIEDRSNAKSSFRILDLCTGTGCIPLLLYSLLGSKFPELEIHGIDISSQALSLARHNLRHNLKHLHLRPEAMRQVSFHYGDILSPDWTQQLEFPYDLVISNPPYISAEGYRTDTSRSVRNYEPKLALVPRDIGNDSSVLPADIFYPQVLKAGALANAKTLLMEVADMQQAIRVATFASRSWRTVEIWRDLPDEQPDSDEPHEIMVLGKRVAVKGSGHGRSVVCWA